MQMKTNCTVMMSVVLVTAGLVAAGAGYEAIVDQSYPLAAGGSVALENINGDVSIEVWERNEVRVYAVKSASTLELLDELEVKVDADNNQVRIDTHYPSMNGSDHGHRRFTKVEYTVTVPRTAILDEIELVNGNLTVVGIEGGIDAETVNGNIMVRDCAGSASLGTVNGGIEAHIDRLDYDDKLDVESVNGQLDLYLASSLGADLSADTVNGSLKNDFGIEVRKGKYVGSDFHGSVGGGGAKVSLETVNGSINVHSW
jgi:DUF4097 and DUF4098 domain-containing protein YvlB